MKNYLYITLLVIPLACHAMDDNASSSCCTASGNKAKWARRLSVDLFKKKAEPKESKTSGDVQYVNLRFVKGSSASLYYDNTSADSQMTPRSPQTPTSAHSKMPVTPRPSTNANARRLSKVSKSSDDSPKSTVSFDNVVTGRCDDNTKIAYIFDDKGRQTPIDIEEDDSDSSSPVQYEIDPAGRKNIFYNDTKKLTSTPLSPGTLLPDSVANAPTHHARRTKYAPIQEEDTEDHTNAYNPLRGLADDNNTHDITCIAAKAVSAELIGRGTSSNNDINALGAMVQSTHITKKLSDDNCEL